MPFYRVNGSLVHLKLGGKAAKNPPPSCRVRVPAWNDGGVARYVCCGISVALCDFPVPNDHAGDSTADQTCSMPLCAEHATEIAPDVHRCPAHLGR